MKVAVLSDSAAQSIVHLAKAAAFADPALRELVEQLDTPQPPLRVRVRAGDALLRDGQPVALERGVTGQFLFRPLPALPNRVAVQLDIPLPQGSVVFVDRQHLELVELIDGTY